jgi:hypothetical protein
MEGLVGRSEDGTDEWYTRQLRDDFYPCFLIGIGNTHR